MRRLLAGAALIALALTLAGSASAHVFPWPVALPQGEAVDVTLSGPNEREGPMTEFSVTAPDGVTLEYAHPEQGWTEQLEESTATWSGGPLPYDTNLEVLVRVRADVEPGPLELRAEQRYADGATVRWPVALTVVPADGGSAQNLAVAAVVALIGVLLVLALAVLAWRRRAPSDSADAGDLLQEK